MSFDSPAKNKMIQTPPEKKEYHFAATAEHYAEVILAATIEEAEEIYHRIKRPIQPSEQSTATPQKEEEKPTVE